MNSTEKILKKYGSLRRGKFRKYYAWWMLSPDVPAFRAPGIWEGNVLADTGFFRKDSFYLNFTAIGVRMEDNVEMIRAVNAEAEESRKTLQKIANDLIKLDESVKPALEEKIREMRSNRMAMVSEVASMMASLKEVRKFFFESDYEKEMDRLERFLRVCREFKEFKESGILDAVADVAIRLAVKEESK